MKGAFSLNNPLVGTARPPDNKAFSPKKGVVFAVNGAPPPPTPAPSPPPPFSLVGGGGFTENPRGGGVLPGEGRGGGARGVCGNFLGGGGGGRGRQGRRAPFTAKTSPFFGENALITEGGGVAFKGGSLHDGFGGFDGFCSAPYPPFACPTQ